MAKRKVKRKIHKNRKRHWLLRREILLLILVLSLFGTGWYLKEKIAFYYAMNFKKFYHKKLKNSEFETQRMNRIIADNTDKVFGIDLSHYQQKNDIKCDSLSIANQSVPIQFVVLRASMGDSGADKHFDHFWDQAKKNGLIRGAYHFYRGDEDHISQANNYLTAVQLTSGDFRPILDIEKISRFQSKEKLIANLKVWLKIVEQSYGEKPIIYTYYHYYNDYLREDFNDYPLWLANYNDVAEPSEKDPWKIWQFSESGIVHGINTKVDLNIYNGGLWSLKHSLTID
jgi:lysozyme